MDFVFLLAFLVLFLLLPPVLGFNYPSASTCPQNFTCHYQLYPESPFSNSLQSDSCGLCMTICNNNSLPKIELYPYSRHWFDVVEEFKNNVIKLHDPILQSLLDNQDCNTFYNTNIPKASGSISYAIVRNSTLFRCSRLPIPSEDNFHGYSKYNTCRDFDVYYMASKYDGAGFGTESSIPQGCSTIQLPVRPSEEVSNDSNLFELLTADFELEWHTRDNCSRLCGLEGFNEFLCPKDETVRRKKSTKTIIILGIAAGGVVVVSVVILALCFITRKRFPWWSYCCMHNKLEDQQIENFLKNNYGSLAPKRYHYSDLKKITNSFDTKLGEGGYGSVYKGKLQDGRLVAVKVLKETKGNKGEEFINEVESISRTSHVNIVTLLGFCFQVHNNKKALIYEFMTNGSLEKFIYGDNNYQGANNRQLEWPTLYRIAVGIARGLEYLHRGCNTRILHFDIKPQNILLDEDFCPKISDFGLAKLCSRRKDSIVSEMDIARGTIGFIAPEIVCKNIGGVSHKSDVYSYGMMVLEMVGGRKNADSRVDRASQTYFPHWIYNRLIMNQGRDDNQEELCLLSGTIMNEEENKQVRKMIMVSLWCIQTNPSSRPTIGNVLEMLEGPLENIQMPPKPYLYSPSRTSSLSEQEEEEGSSPPDYVSFLGCELDH